jgi:hypothetical protein
MAYRTPFLAAAVALGSPCATMYRNPLITIMSNAIDADIAKTIFKIVGIVLAVLGCGKPQAACTIVSLHVAAKKDKLCSPILTTQPISNECYY